MTEWWHYPLLVVVGFVVGFINTVAGGASLISLPTLIFLGLPPAVAPRSRLRRQVVSTREDLLEKEYINVLKDLQDNVPGFGGAR